MISVLIVNIALITSGVILFLIGILSTLMLVVGICCSDVDVDGDDIHKLVYATSASFGILFIGLSL